MGMSHVNVIADAPVSSLATAMLFGTVTFATVALASRTWLIGDSRAFQSAMSPRSQPLNVRSFTSIYTLFHHFTTFGIILFFAYLCENHPFYPHGEKVYDRDQFFFLIGLLFLVSFYTVQKNDSANISASSERRTNISSSSTSSKLGDKLQALSQKPNEREEDEASESDSTYSSLNEGTVITSGTYIRAKETKSCNDVLNRDQTEEWKGWMQFVFLIYHYYHAEEVYNSIRIMITCYVWMTGFGNFSFFYLKNDYSMVRVLQMLWRLNFLVIFLCLSQGSTYLLYYICPLHTYFFLMVYISMRVGKRLNYSKYGLRIKLSVVALIIFLIWDVDYGVFKIMHFPFLGTQPILGATNGSMWEWYFRTTLDHWSTFLGMVFAANFPITSLFYRKLEALSPLQCWLGKAAVGIPLFVAFIAWLVGPFMLAKFEYNMTNPYFGFLPLITYIYFRNLTPGLRSHSLKLLHEIGKTTLETYLMQHHIWLTSNAKTVLILIPGWPKVNMMVVTIIYFLTSRKLYKLTLQLRAMLLPNDIKKCLQSLVTLISFIILFYGVAVYLTFLGYATLKVVGLVSIVCGALLYQTIMDLSWDAHASSDTSDEMSMVDTFFSSNVAKDSFVAKSFPSIISAMVILIIGIGWQGMAVTGAAKNFALHSGCSKYVNKGHWIPIDGCNEAARGMAYRNDRIENFATCQPSGAAYTWGWEGTPASTRCSFTQRSEKKLKKKLNRRRIGFVGDSMVRNLYHSVSRQFGVADAGHFDAGGLKHVDISRVIDSTALDFRWAPMASEQLETMKQLRDDVDKKDVSKYDAIILGGGAWDRLYRFGDTTEITTHSTTIEAIIGEIETLKKLGIPVVWVIPTTINTPALNSPEKRDHMTEEDMADMRSVYDTLGLLRAASFVIDGTSYSKERVDESYDGVHYPQDVYDAGAQILANAFDWLLPDLEVMEKFTPPEPGKMAKPFLGGMMLCLCFIGLFFFDGFFGFSYLACLFVKGLLPSDLYLEAFAMLHEKSRLPPLSSGESVRSEATFKTKNTAPSKSSLRNKTVNEGRVQKSSPSRSLYGVDDEIAALLGESPGEIELRNRTR